MLVDVDVVVTETVAIEVTVLVEVRVVLKVSVNCGRVVVVVSVVEVVVVMVALDGVTVTVGVRVDVTVRVRVNTADLVEVPAAPWCPTSAVRQNVRLRVVVLRLAATVATEYASKSVAQVESCILINKRVKCRQAMREQWLSNGMIDLNGQECSCFMLTLSFSHKL